MLDGYISDLEPGDELRSVTFTVTPHMAAAYARGMEEHFESFQGPAPDGTGQMRSPAAIHTDKMRLLEENCSKEQRLHGEQAKDARMHYEYEAQQHSPAFVGDELTVTGRITDKYERRGRTFLCYALEVNTADGRLVTSYKDKTLLRYKKED